MAADAAVSLGVVIGGVLLIYTGWLWLDPAISLVIILVVMISGWELFRESLNLSMDAVPSHIDARQVQDVLEKLPGVTQVHDLHIWAMSTTETALTAHLVMPAGMKNPDDFLAGVTRHLRETFAIHHTTLQLENNLEHPSCGVDCDSQAGRQV
jgi:cobalt-zinc-cadmium efflux system protein